MRYRRFIKNLKECPFCNFKKENVLYENNFGSIILGRAPYTKYHLIVYPKKHATRISDLTNLERLGLFELVFFAQEKIRKINPNHSILYREGDKKKIGKSIDHLHINIIPKEQVGLIKKDVRKRAVFSEEEYLKEIEKARVKLKIDK